MSFYSFDTRNLKYHSWELRALRIAEDTFSTRVYKCKVIKMWGKMSSKQVGCLLTN